VRPEEQVSRRIRVRGLAVLAAWIFGLWGALVSCKGLYDLFWGVPEANAYSPQPWGFVTREAWLRYGGFELSYGICCLALAWYLVRYSRFLPESIERETAG